jgi:hypothetical protein
VPNQDIECPKCGHAFAITEALARPIVEAERNRMEQESRQRSTALAAQEEELRRRREQLDEQQRKQQAATAGVELELQKKAAALDHEKRQLELTVSRQLDQEREGIRQHAVLQEQTRSQVAMIELNDQLAESRRIELDVRKERENLKAEKESLDLIVLRRVDEQRGLIREEEENRNHFKLAEKDKVIDDMRKQAEAIRRKSDPGNRQGDGEEQEKKLEATLRAQFPSDIFEPVVQGRAGADIVQKVVGPTGTVSGIILWESKRTQTWQAGWLATVRENQRSAHANVSVIASTALPKGLTLFDCMDDVWVSSFECVVPLAKALRKALILTNMAQVSEEDRSGKIERMYGYVTGQDFQHRVSSIVEGYETLQKDLEKEKRFISAGWARRAKHHEQIMFGVEGMGGDLAGIVGESTLSPESPEEVERKPLPFKDLAAD